MHVCQLVAQPHFLGPQGKASSATSGKRSCAAAPGQVLGTSWSEFLRVWAFACMRAFVPLCLNPTVWLPAGCPPQSHLPSVSCRVPQRDGLGKVFPKENSNLPSSEGTYSASLAPSHNVTFFSSFHPFFLMKWLKMWQPQTPIRAARMLSLPLAARAALWSADRRGVIFNHLLLPEEKGSGLKAAGR